MLGRNEQAARYSGIKTERLTILAYVICSTLAGFGGILFMLDLNSVQPSSHGNFYELYAIAAAVLGGCSLRGGEGSIIGVMIGMGILQMLKSASLFWKFPTNWNLRSLGPSFFWGPLPTNWENGSSTEYDKPSRIADYIDRTSQQSHTRTNLQEPSPTGIFLLSELTVQGRIAGGF